MKNKGITLVALVITIIILIILAGITISILGGENGLIERARKSSLEYKKSQYIEEINLAIFEETMERTTNQKSEAFIVSLNKRLVGDQVASVASTNVKERKWWVSSTVMCDTNGVENVDNFLNTILIVTTVEDYEIYVNVDNEKQTAEVQVDSYKKAEAPCQITYDLNNGTGTLTNATTSIRNGFKLTLPSGTGISRQYYTFAGWCKDKNGNGTIYTAGARTDEKITKDTTFYAIWTQNSVTVTYEGNGGEGTMEASTIIIGQATKLPANGYTKTGYTFSKWASNKGQEYTNEEEITITEDITLTAVWAPIPYTINVVNGKFGDETTSKTVNYGESITATASGLPSSGWSEWAETTTGTKVSTNKTYAWTGETTKTIIVTGNETITFNYTETTVGTKTKYKVSFDGYSDKDLWTSDTGDGTFTFPEGPEQQGKTFQGWNTDNTATSGTAAGQSGTVSKPTTYYVIWKTPQMYKYIKWHITKHRADAQGFNGALHVAEFKLLSKQGDTYSEYTFASGTTVTSTKAGYDSSQVIGKIIDGNISTKYFANWWANSDGTGDCVITITLPSAIDFSTYKYYAFYTAGDLSECDPSTWKLYLSNTGNSNDWTEVDSKTRELVTTTRSARTDVWEMNI